MKCPRCDFEFKTVARNLKQNALYHMWMGVIADDLGCYMEDIKRDVKRHILGQKQVINKLSNKAETEDYETSNMNMQDMASFMDKIKIWAQTDLNIYLPYFKDPGYEEMKKHFKSR